MAQWLGTLTALPRDPGLIPSTQIRLLSLVLINSHSHIHIVRGACLSVLEMEKPVWGQELWLTHTHTPSCFS